MSKKADIIFCPNGNTIVFIDGKQSPPHQISWFKMFVDFLDTIGVDVMNSDFMMPDGIKAKLIKTGNGYNWKIE